jgi:DNA repair protein RecN (Recombination protein N)
LYVFDEVDAGIGGAVAEVIGRKIRDVSRHHQVICITHLAPIAVYADAHYRVQKSIDNGRTRSMIVRLSADEGREEIARMLGGIEITRETRAAAREMLKGARR